MKSWIIKYHRRVLTIALAGGLLGFFVLICYLNLSQNPGFYCTDMYSDMLYAVRAWEEKTIFPDGWVFGNQFYVIATPVVSALLYGITQDMTLSMALASILMTLGIALSFLWMLKPVFSRLEERLTSLLGLVVLTAYCGDAIYAINGWQLLFTMCSYYACYLITAFLCFGCFLRRQEKLTRPYVAMLTLTLLLCFGSGMQSLRQTAVMLPPIICLEAITQGRSLIKHKRLQLRPLMITLIMVIANLLGLLTIRLLKIPQHEIFYSLKPVALEKLTASLNAAMSNLSELLCKQERFGVLLLAVLVSAILAYFQSKWQREAPTGRLRSLILLIAVSVLVIVMIDAFTQMSVRSIYYFMLFPLIAVLMGFAYCFWRGGRAIVLVVLAVLMIGALHNSVIPSVRAAGQAKDNISYEISDLLIEKGYTTVYSGWNQCEDIAIASDGRITAGFWNRSKGVFQSVDYLCDPSIYETESDKCAYYLRRDNRDIALQEAKKRGITMTLIAAYPERGIWLYEASENLMR